MIYKDLENTNFILTKFTELVDFAISNSEEFEAFQKNHPCQIYCSKECHRRGYTPLSDVCGYNRIGTIMPIDKLFVFCCKCHKRISSDNQLFVAKPTPFGWSRTTPEEENKKFILEAIFCKYLLYYCFVKTALDYTSKGIFYSLNDNAKATLTWGSMLFDNIRIPVEEGLKLYRVQSIPPDFPETPVPDKSFMRSSDIEFTGGAKRFNRIGNWHLYLAFDKATAIKEGRIKKAPFFSSEFVVKKSFSCLDVRKLSLNSRISTVVLNNFYSAYVSRFGENIQAYILAHASIAFCSEFFAPSLVEMVLDRKSYKIDYAICQLLTDIAINGCFDSLLYKSVQHEDGQCLCFFDEDKIDEHFDQTEIFTETQIPTQKAN